MKIIYKIDDFLFTIFPDQIYGYIFQVISKLEDI